MKVAVASPGESLDAPVDARLGRCANIVAVETESMSFEVHSNPGALAGTGAGIAAAQVVADSGAEAVIAGSFGPNAVSAFAAGGIKAYVGSGTVREAVRALLDGKLRLFGES